jgi:hypothetical protein
VVGVLFHRTPTYLFVDETITLLVAKAKEKYKNRVRVALGFINQLKIRRYFVNFQGFHNQTKL